MQALHITPEQAQTDADYFNKVQQDNINARRSASSKMDQVLSNYGFFQTND